MSLPSIRTLRACIAVACLAATPTVAMAQTVAPVAVTPSSVAVGVGAAVVVTATITDPAVIPNGVQLNRYDSQGRVIAVMGALVDDGTAGDATAGDKVFTWRRTVYELVPGPITLRVSAAFKGRVLRVLSAPMTLTIAGTASTISITQPANLDFRNVSPILVTGIIGDRTAQVKVNGIAASLSGNTFTAQVPVLEGTNTLTAVATNSNGTVTTASVQVTLDTTPPRLSITAPDTTVPTTASAVTVAGIVNDIVVGTVNAQQATVAVNGIAAQVSNRTFSAANVPLVLGPNTIQVTATDRSGNRATTSVVVTRSEATGAISAFAGTNQTGPAGGDLAQPRVARVVNTAGQGVPGVPVVFRVAENGGGLISGSTVLGSQVVTSDADGRASVRFRLGPRSGVGNHVVEASATGFTGIATFAHSATAGSAKRIVVDTGNGQIGTISQALALPFVVVVTDANANRINGVPVTFAVKQGGGTLGGATSKTVATDPDGRAAVVLTLGSQPGSDNNVVEATFAGNAGAPSAFLATALVPGDVTQTRVKGVVLDNANHPLQNVTMRMFRTHHGTGVPEQVTTPVVTGANGQFVIQPAPVGTFKLMADGSTAANGPWPTLEFDLVTVSGQTVDVGLPIYLPKLDALHQLCVTETTGGTLYLPEVPGFSLTLEPGAATFPGGSRSGCVTVTPVNADKVPMAPSFGQQPRFIVTIQPVGALFNPAARLTLPNVDGLPPRQVTELYSYDHDLSAFVSIGTGRVSDDGSIVVSDPGVGVIKAGWHGGGAPTPSGSAGSCGDCQRCQGSGCVPDNSNVPADVQGDCLTFGCAGGAPTQAPDNADAPPQSCCFNGSPVSKFNITDLAQCPNRVSNPQWQMEFDGCSVPYVAPEWRNNPAQGFSTLFSDSHTASPTRAYACDQHDTCYQTCHGTNMIGGQETCDLILRNVAYSTCTDSLLDPRDVLLGASERCFIYAEIYYEGLSNTGGGFGRQAFEDRQKQVCQCCP